eukprot:GEMP01040063.1.p1 GENE.GEMP01040063.1~~GEMP01040063.1.p1  ORF type:complete len:201 (+),score=35.26 GEMP01040063.1:304-906(+)
MMLLVQCLAAVAAACCYRIGYGDRMVPCCLKLDENLSEQQCLGTEDQPLLGGAVGWHATCPSSAHEAADWIKKQKSASGDGCCFQIGYGSMMKPCCLKTESLSEATCKIDRRMGGASGWASTCPASAEQANEIIQAAKAANDDGTGKDNAFYQKQLDSKAPADVGWSTGAIVFLVIVVGLLVMFIYQKSNGDVTGYRIVN